MFGCGLKSCDSQRVQKFVPLCPHTLVHTHTQTRTRCLQDLEGPDYRRVHELLLVDVVLPRCPSGRMVCVCVCVYACVCVCVPMCMRAHWCVFLL